MPRRFRRRSKTTKVAIIKTKRKRPSKETIYRSRIPGLIYPDKLFCRMVFAETWSGLVASAFVDTLYAGNNVFNTLGIVGGVSARMFANVILNYTRYYVSASMIKVQIVSTGAVDPVMVVLVPSSSAVLFTSLNQAEDNPRAKSSRITSIAQRDSATVIHRSTSNKELGISKNMIGDDVFCGTTASNSGQTWSWHVCIGTPNLAATGLWSARVKVIYDVMWFDRLTSPA